MAERDYRKIFPLDGKEFITSQGRWRASVSEYPHLARANEGLLHLKISFEFAKKPSRLLDLWIEDAPDVTLVAESVGMIEAINLWLEGSKGDDELRYDSGLGELVPHRPSRH